MPSSPSSPADEARVLRQRIAELERELNHQSAMRRSAERARERSSLLADVSRILTEPGDLHSILTKFVQRAATRIADWAAVDVLDADGALTRLAVHHADPDKVQLAQELYDRYPPQPADPVFRALRTREPEWIERIPDTLLEVLAHDEEHLRIARSLGLKSYIIAPLLVNGHPVGALTLVTAESGRCYNDDDVDLAMDVASRVAFVIQNHRLRTLALESERSLRDLVDSLGAIIWQGDANTFQFQFVSRRAEQILGYPVERWMEPGFWASIVHPDQRQWAIGRRTECVREGRDYELEYAVTAADGRLVWLRDAVYIRRDEKGNAWRLAGLMLDVTAQMNAAGA